jgi:hypothetical protein
MHKENIQRDTVDGGIELVLFSHYMEILTVSYARGFRARESSEEKKPTSEQTASS